MAELRFPDPPLSNESLTLRRWSATDLPALVTACQDYAIARFVAAIPSPYSETDAREWLDSQEPARRAGARLDLAAASTQADRLLGSITLSCLEWEHSRAMVSFWVAPNTRGERVASGALRLLSRWALGPLGLARLELFIEPDNGASQRVAERCGFTREGLLRSRWISKGHRRDSIIYGLLAHELPAP